MSTDKFYYTPDISEFCVGFEYEFRHPDFSEWIKYETPVFNAEEEDCFLSYYSTECFRVKRLDIDDMKSLGFTFSQIPMDSFDWGWNVTNGYTTGTVIEEDLNGVVTELELFGWTLEIKNKFELKKLLTQFQMLNND